MIKDIYKEIASACVGPFVQARFPCVMERLMVAIIELRRHLFSRVGSGSVGIRWDSHLLLFELMVSLSKSSGRWPTQPELPMLGESSLLLPLATDVGGASYLQYPPSCKIGKRLCIRNGVGGARSPRLDATFLT